MQTGSSETLIGWKSGKTTFVPLWERMEGAWLWTQSPYFLTFMEPRNQFQGINSASLCSLAGRYDNPIPPRFLAHIDSLKIPAQNDWELRENMVEINTSLYRPCTV
jgi:hypothetical protein